MKHLRVALVVASIGLSSLLAASSDNAIPESAEARRRDPLDAYLCFHASIATDTMLVALPSRRSRICGESE